MFSRAFLGQVLAALAAFTACGGRPASPSSSAGGPSPPSLPSSGDGEVVIGGALPAGQLARIGGPRLSHPTIAQQVGVAAGGAIVSAGGSHVRVWDPATGALRWQSFVANSQARFAISADGRRVAAAHEALYTGTGHVTLFEIGGEEQGSFAVGPASALAFSPDGTKLVVANVWVEVFEVAGGQRLATLKVGAEAVSFTPDGAIVAVSRDVVRRWRWSEDSVEIALPFAAPPDEVALARDGAAVAWAVGARVGVARLVAGTEVKNEVKNEARNEARNGARIEARIEAEIVAPGPVHGLALAPLADAIAVGWEGGLGVWSIGEQPRQRWLVSGGRRVRAAMAFSSTGQTLVAAETGGISSRDADRGTELVKAGEPTRFLDFSGDGNLFLWRGKAIELLDLRNGARVVADGLPADAPEWANEFAYGAGGVVMGWNLVDALQCGPLEVWLRGAGERIVPPGLQCDEDSAGWTLGPGLAVAAGAAPEVWDVVGQRTLLFLPPRPAPRIGVAFSADRRWMAVAYGPESPSGEDGGGGEGDGEGDDEGKAEAGDEADHGLDPRYENHVIEVVDLSAALPAAAPGPWKPARVVTWAGQVALEGVAILSDGTVFAGAEDGAVLAAAPGEKELREVSRMGARVASLKSSPTGTAVAITDADDRTVLFAGAIALPASKTQLGSRGAVE